VVCSCSMFLWFSCGFLVVCSCSGVLSWGMFLGLFLVEKKDKRVERKIRR